MSDRFHIFNHLCSDVSDPRSYHEMDGVDTGAPEQRKAPIRAIQTSLRDMGVENYTALLAYQSAVLTHEAQMRAGLGVDRLPEDVDMSLDYFRRFSCTACRDVVAQRQAEQETAAHLNASAGSLGHGGGFSSSNTGSTCSLQARYTGDESSGRGSDSSGEDSSSTCGLDL